MVNSIVVFAFTIVLTVEYISGSFLYHDSRTYEGSPCRTADKRRGKCKAICPTLTEEQTKENQCGFLKSAPLFCCPRILWDGTNLYPLIEQACADRNQTLEESNRSAEELRKRDLEEENYSEWAQNEIYNTVRSIRKANIAACEKFSMEIGGNGNSYFRQWCKFLEIRYHPARQLAAAILAAVKNEHPHMAALGWTDPDNLVEWNCGGAAIHPKFVLTAAHCIFNIGKPPDRVQIGSITLSTSGNDNKTNDYAIDNIFIHELFKSDSSESHHDIAIIKIKGRKKFLKPLPACLWTKPEYPSNQLLMMGFGAPAFGKEFLSRLFHGNLTIIEQKKCVESYEERSIEIIQEQFCAADPKGFEDTCEGDSGGPFQYNANDEWKTPYLVGITSFGITCVTGPPGVYTKIYNYLGWIEKIIRENQ